MISLKITYFLIRVCVCVLLFLPIFYPSHDKLPSSGLCVRNLERERSPAVFPNVDNQCMCETLCKSTAAAVAYARIEKECVVVNRRA